MCVHAHACVCLSHPLCGMDDEGDSTHTQCRKARTSAAFQASLDRAVVLMVGGGLWLLREAEGLVWGSVVSVSWWAAAAACRRCRERLE